MARAKSPTAPSTPRLSEAARHVVIPSGIVTTAWPRVEAKLAEIGVRFDRWQDGAGQIILGKRADGSFAATVGGVVLSIPRQVGKTFLVGMIVVALCLLFPGLTVVWTAHRTRTSTKTFQTLKAMTSKAKVAPHMLEPRNVNGEQEVRFRNGSVIMFGAREQGFGRGFDQVDIAVFDEAQILSERGVEDIVPATNQAVMPGGALLFFMGTPPRPTDPGEEFTNRRKEALSGESEDTVYIEFSADEDAGLDDPKQWAKANPSFPSRTPVSSMKRMRKNLTNDDSFRREALGIWTTTKTEARLFAPAAWQRSQDESTKVGRRLAMAVHFTPARDAAAVAVASWRPDGRLHVELIAHEDGVAWALPYVQERAKRHQPVAVGLAGGMAAGHLAADLERLRGFKALAAGDVKRACARLYDLVNETPAVLAVRPHPDLDQTIAIAKRSSPGAEWLYVADEDDQGGLPDLSPVYAIALAAWLAGKRRSTQYSVEDSLY